MIKDAYYAVKRPQNLPVTDSLLIHLTQEENGESRVLPKESNITLAENTVWFCLH